MHYLKDADYRLGLAGGFLKEAQEDFSLKRWRSCVDNSQLSLENSVKSIISLFEPVEKSHNPVLQLKNILNKKVISSELEKLLKKKLANFSKLGFEEHFLTDYGDEIRGKLPWELFKRPHAQKALKIAEEAFGLAKIFYHRLKKII